MKKCFSCVLLLLSVLLASVFLATQASADDSFEENRSANNRKINSQLQDKNYARVDRLEVRVLSRDEATNDNDNQAPLSKYQYTGVVREQEFIDSVPVTYVEFESINKEYVTKMFQYRLKMIKLSITLYKLMLDKKDIDLEELKNDLSYCKEHGDDDVLSYSDLYDFRLSVFDAADKILNKKEEISNDLKEIVKKDLLIEYALLTLDFPYNAKKQDDSFHIFGKESLENIFKLVERATKEAPPNPDKNFYVVELSKKRLKERLPEFLDLLRRAGREL